MPDPTLRRLLPPVDSNEIFQPAERNIFTRPGRCERRVRRFADSACARLRLTGQLHKPLVGRVLQCALALFAADRLEIIGDDVLRLRQLTRAGRAARLCAHGRAGCADERREQQQRKARAAYAQR